MKKLVIVVCFLLIGTVAQAATVSLQLAWTVTNTPTIPATSYRVEENVAGTWGAVTTVAAPTLNYNVTGRAPGTYTFRVIPVANGLDGSPSNTSICGAAAPDTTLSLTCLPLVTP